MGSTVLIDDKLQEGDEKGFLQNRKGKKERGKESCGIFQNLFTFANKVSPTS